MKKILLIVTGMLLITALEARAQQFPVNCPTAALAYTSATHKYTCNTGPLLMANGSESAPSYSFATDPTTGIFITGDNFTVSNNGTSVFNIGTESINLASTGRFYWAANTIYSSPGLVLEKDADNVLAQRNDTNAQTFRIYNTFTDVSNYERGFVRWTSNIFEWGTEQAGSGSSRNLRIVRAGSTYADLQATEAIWYVNNFRPDATNTRTLGTSLQRWLQFYVGTSGIDSTGPITATLYNTTTNCSSSASPAVCSAAPAGSVVIAAGATTVTVNTTAVTANSQIMITEDSSLGTKLSVTCNTTLARNYAITARTAATSFVITTDVAPVTNPACISYVIIN